VLDEPQITVLQHRPDLAPEQARREVQEDADAVLGDDLRTLDALGVATRHWTLTVRDRP
jgi:hypothetical protein